MNLRELISFLSEQDQNKVVPLGFNNPHSYRGYYDQLAFEPAYDVTIGSMLIAATESRGKTFIGYKGGEYTMYEYTDVWVSRYGWNDGEKIGFILMKLLVGADIVKDRRIEILSEQWCTE